MLYVLVGNGSPNKKEVVKSIESLEVDELVLIGYDVVNPATLAILNRLNENGTKYTVVFPKDFIDPEESAYGECDAYLEAKRPVARALSYAANSVLDGEPWRLLVMSDDLDNDEDALFAVSACLDNGIEVFDLASQMLPIAYEVSDEPEPETEEPEVAEALKLVEKVAEASPALDDLTRSDLENLTRDELKSIVVSKGLSPKDMRSKESLIKAILEGSSEEEAAVEVEDVAEAPEAPDAPEAEYYLVTISGGVPVIERLTNEQYSQLTF